MRHKKDGKMESLFHISANLCWKWKVDLVSTVRQHNYMVHLDCKLDSFKTPRLDTFTHLMQSQAWIYIAMEVEKSLPSKLSNWRTKKDPQFDAFCLNLRT